MVRLPQYRLLKNMEELLQVITCEIFKHTYQNLDSNIQLLAIFLWMLMTEDLLLKMRVTLFGPICLLNAGD